MSNRTKRSPFVRRVEGALRDRFADCEHSPSEEIMDGLLSIADTIELMAKGEAERITYLSESPVGAGKTTTVIESIVQLMKDPQHRDCGIIVFLHTKDQIRNLAERLREAGISRSELAIEVGTDPENDYLRQLGRGHFNTKRKWVSEQSEARIVIATQAKLLYLVRSRYVFDFDNLWRYQGEPRRVRIWDEALLPAEPVVATLEEVRIFRDLLATRGCVSAAKDIDDWMKELSGEVAVTEVPTFALGLPLALDEDDPLFAEGSLGAKLFSMQGRSLRVRKDHKSKPVALHYMELLPENFAPILVLDASGDLRVLYNAWEQGRSGLVRLPSGKKRYDHLTIHHFDTAAGVNAHRFPETLDQLAEAAASVLNNVPEGEMVLFIVRKPDKPFQDMEVRITAKVRAMGIEPAKRIRFTTWGLHTATNQFNAIKHVVEVGVLQAPLSVTEAMLRAAGKMSAVTDLADKQVHCARLGEAAHHIFQAAGRGSVRFMEGDQCPEGCTLWTIFCTKGPMTIPRALLPHCFPGAKIVDWKPFGLRMRDSNLKTDNRVRFAEALVGRLGEAISISFEVRDLEPEFHRSMSFRFLSKETVVRDYLRQSYGLLLEKGEPIKRGRVKADTFVLRREGS